MKIAQIAPLYEAVPPKLYGGTERLVAHLCEALAEQGHDVTLFASADSQVTHCEQVKARSQALRLDPNPLKSDIASHFNLLEKLYARRHEFDMIHFHTEYLHFPMFEDVASKTLTTLHGRLDLADLPDVYRYWRQYPLASISDSQRRPLPFANWAGTIYHGLNPDCYQFHEDADGHYLAFLGRISPEKRPDRAIEIAKRVGIPLKIAAKVSEQDQPYFKQQIEPLFDDPLIEFVGEINDQQKSAFLGNALGLLFPIDWPEPFGLVMIEAMACGTPVVAWRCGSVPEIIDDGISGYIVDNIEQAVLACEKLHQLDRPTIRDQFIQRFSSATMAQNYMTVYQKLIQHSDNAVTVKFAG
ncbi:MAG: Phosphatidyl-myo-inositol mannosyltransferase [Candidatus Celerinatantimonas neptuna]|nr:MAG: Phosphatidyl-myo-inositol mannosyltransferase [Candidatus Celerinatantimonas neptuna]